MHRPDPQPKRAQTMADVDVLPQNPCYVSVKASDDRLTISGDARTLAVGEMVQLDNVSYPIAEPTFWNPGNPSEMIITLQVSGFVPANLPATQANAFNDCADCESSLVEILFI